MRPPEAGNPAQDRLLDLGNRLRSLLNVILGHAQLFDLNPNLDAESRGQIREIEQAARALAVLAEELSGLSRPAGAEVPPPGKDSAMPGVSAVMAVPRSLRVLLVEDNPVNQAVLGRLLETFGCTADVVANGREALAQWQAGDYGLILADLNMPGMNGFELARAVRARETAAGGRIPIVAVTAATVAEARPACRAAGMDEVLAKPVELDALRAMLRRWRIGRATGSAPAPAAAGPEPALAGLFIAMARQDLADVRRLLWTRDGQGLADIMHKLKSSALSVGAGCFSRLAADLEQSARNGLWREAEGRCGELEKALADFESASAEAVPCGDCCGGSIAAEEMRQAILRDEFEVYFQPKVDAASLQPVCVEALARWHSDRHGWVPPEVFIRLAERHDLIGPLSELLLTKALFGGARLDRAGFPLTIAVNLSASWLAQPQLPEFILATLRAVGMPAGRVVLEIAEAEALDVAPAVLDGMERLRRQGLGFSIGGLTKAGWSPDWLRCMGFGQLKLGRALRNAAHTTLPSRLEQVRALGIAMVAEGVETPEDLEWARALNCGLVQGHLIATAMPLEDLLRWLQVRF